jgi:hypothetical protein
MKSDGAKEKMMHFGGVIRGHVIVHKFCSTLGAGRGGAGAFQKLKCPQDVTYGLQYLLALLKMCMPNFGKTHSLGLYLPFFCL